MSVYSRVNRASRARTLDRGTWAENTVVVLTLDVRAPGEQGAHEVAFGTVFEHEPLFTYGVELVEGQTLVARDFPFVSCGVADWTPLQVDPANPEEVYFVGATLWINIVCNTEYRLRFRLGFEGVAFKNVERLSSG